MDVQGRRLSRYGLHNPGMAVADMRHVIVHVEIAPAIDVIKPHPLSANYMQWLIIEQRRMAADYALSAL